MCIRDSNNCVQETWAIAVVVCWCSFCYVLWSHAVLQFFCDSDQARHRHKIMLFTVIATLISFPLVMIISCYLSTFPSASALLIRDVEGVQFFSAVAYSQCSHNTSITIILPPHFFLYLVCAKSTSKRSRDSITIVFSVNIL